MVTGDERHLVWDELGAGLAVLSDLSIRSTASGYEAFRSQVLARIAPEPFALLKRQRRIFERARMTGELFKFDILLEGRAGIIREISCLESLLLAEHLGAHPERPELETEFSAFILERAGALRVYFQSGRKLSTPDPKPALERIARDLVDGWRVLSLLHNHPFAFENPSGDMSGTTIPSRQDADVFVYFAGELGLEQAWITNGFNTLVLKASEFAAFSGVR